MERLRRSFTFSGRKQRRQSEEQERKSRDDASRGHKNEENGTENPDAGFRQQPGNDRLRSVEGELETMRRQFGDAEDRYREAHGAKRVGLTVKGAWPNAGVGE
jgi:hypothetical protein